MYSKHTCVYIYIHTHTHALCVLVKTAEVDEYFHGNRFLFLPETIKAIFKISYNCK